MQAINSINSLQSPGSLFSLSLGTSPVGGTQSSSPALQKVIDQLASALTQNGQLDQSSPLGNMLSKVMQGSGIEAVKTALEKLIRDKLGDNFVAASDKSGSDNGAAANAGNAGQSDLLTQVLNGLAKAMLEDLLSKQGDSSSFSSKDQPILQQVAQFMDANKGVFSTPDSGSWANEFKEDNYLNADETSQVRAALGLIAQQLGKQQVDTGSTADAGSVGGLGTPLSQPASSLSAPEQASGGNSAGSNSGADLGQLLGELVELGLQSALAGNGGLGSPLNAGNSSGNTASGNGTSGNGVASDLGKLLSGLLERGLEVALQGQSGVSNLQNSAEQTAGQILNTLLQGNQTQAVA